MRITRGQHNLKPRPEGCVVTLGNFDGVHLGHQAVMAQAAEAGRAQGLPLVAMTFEPLPREFFDPDQPLARLTRLRERYRAMAGLGIIDELVVLHFDSRLAALPAEGFVQAILVGGLSARHVVVGDDFRFGAGRQGDHALLARLGQIHGFTVEKARTFLLDGERVSSTRVRAALAEGDLALATHLLGRPYAFCGRVAHGDKRGRTLGYPTANLALHRRHSPLSGVYVVETALPDGRLVAGVANVGRRPTVGGLRARLEVHLFDFDESLYGQVIEVRFLHRLRPERQFDSVDMLVRQIGEDARMARAWLETGCSDRQAGSPRHSPPT
ncbi:MAG: bifunctional riboflavin kinase/FAD synthetase [Halothiobacillaceae bacterium]